jgi:thiosulfate dehydrogenase
MYDAWWKAVEGATEPAADNPLWALQSTNTRSGSTTWRCKECHGWDYKGKDGAYATGSHFTGFPGVYAAATTKTKDQLTEIMKGGNNAQHDLSSVLSEAALTDLVNFLSEGLIDDAKYINYDTKKAIGADVANGETLYTSACVACHGADGKLIDFNDGEGIGALSNDNPWEVLHKIRFGQPGEPMPAGVNSGWSDQDAVDVLGYSQTLPE